MCRPMRPGFPRLAGLAGFSGPAEVPGSCATQATWKTRPTRRRVVYAKAIPRRPLQTFPGAGEVTNRPDGGQLSTCTTITLGAPALPREVVHSPAVKRVVGSLDEKALLAVGQLQSPWRYVASTAPEGRKLAVHRELGDIARPGRSEAQH